MTSKLAKQYGELIIRSFYIVVALLFGEAPPNYSSKPYHYNYISTLNTLCLYPPCFITPHISEPHPTYHVPYANIKIMFLT